MFQLLLCLLSASLAVGTPLSNEAYGLGTIIDTTDYMKKDYDVVIFVNDEMYNLGENYTAIETALRRYNGVSERLIITYYRWWITLLSIFFF